MPWGPGRPAGRRGAALAVAALVLLSIPVQGKIESLSATPAAARPLLYLPSGKYLHLTGLGFDTLMADAIYLWSIQYYGNYAIGDRYDYLEHIYGDVISELDPHYIDPYLIGSLIMNTEARRSEMALRLLDKGIAANPDRWILAFEAGFLCYSDLKDYARAATYFEKALRAPDVHPLVRRLYAEMYRRAGDRRASLREWSEIETSAADDYVRTIAGKHVHDLRVEVDLMDLAALVESFHARVGKLPVTLEEMVARGVAAQVPRDPEDREYLYDRATGRVAYAGRLVLGS